MCAVAGVLQKKVFEFGTDSACIEQPVGGLSALQIKGNNVHTIAEKEI